MQKLQKRFPAGGYGIVASHLPLLRRLPLSLPLKLLNWYYRDKKVGDCVMI